MMDTAPHTNHNSGEGLSALPFTAGEWARGRDRVRVAISRYRGKPLVDIRAWYQASDGEWRPSPKGITLALDTLPKLALALDVARAFVQAHGLLQEGGGQ